MKKKRRKKPLRSIIESCKDPTRTEVFQAAMAYKKAGLSFLPIEADRSKSPAFRLLPTEWCERRQKLISSWAPLKNRQPTDTEVYCWFNRGEHVNENGIAIIAGKVSGNLEILDLDTADLVEPFRRLVIKKKPGLYKRLVKVITPRPGFHLYYRCSEIEGNQKLARIPDPDSDKRKPKTVIETRGEGGYCLAPPSPDWCHPREKCYLFTGEKDLTDVPTITPEERQVLLNAARSLDRWKTTHPKRGRSRQPSLVHGTNLRPGDDFNRRADWSDILTPHGWVYDGPGGDGTERWTRPGKVEGSSASTGFGDLDWMYVFTTNADPFEDEVWYSKFQAFALLEHDGDFFEAAADLKRRGYGRSSPQNKRKRTRNRLSR